MRLASALFVALFALACVGEVPDRVGEPGSGEPGGGGEPGEPGGGPQPGVTPTVGMAMTPSVFDLSLGRAGTAEVTVTSIDGYVGDVAVDVTGAMPSWEITVTPETVTLGAGGTATAVVTVNIPTDAQPAELGQALAVVATPLEEARDLSLTEAATATVENVYYATVAAGTGEGGHTWPSVTLQVGAAIEFSNADSITHRIHSNHDGVGFPHQPNPGLEPGNPETNYRVSITSAGVYNEFYCHSHGAGTGNGVITMVNAVE